MPFCENCGFKLNDDARFCPECGAVNVRSSASSAGEAERGDSADRSESPRTQMDSGGTYGADYKNLPQGFVLDERFRIEQRAGVGGFAVVYKATDMRLQLTRAVKIFLDIDDGDEYALDKLRHEARLMEKITDERIVRFFDLKLDGTPKFVVMEYADGGSLEQLIMKSDGKLDETRALEIAKEIASAITPVPGGVGPVTVAKLLENTLHCANVS